MRRWLWRSMRAAWIMSERADICWSPNMLFISANTRSHAAELGEIAKATRAASAHTRNDLALVRHHKSSASVKCSTLDVSKVGAPAAAER